MDPQQNEDVFNSEEEIEKRHFQSVLSAFSHYRTQTILRVNKTEKFIQTLPDRHQNRLEKYVSYLSRIKWCIDENDSIIKDILQDVGDMFENIPSEQLYPTAEHSVCKNLENGESDNRINPVRPKLEDIDKVQSVLKQFVRDWSSSGSRERLQCYQPILTALCSEFPNSNGIKVLVPGAGLGRLAFEIAMRGFVCQGNEFSLFMLFASNFILNKCHEVDHYKVYPWVHQFVNNLSCDHQIQEAYFPDVDPSTLAGADFSMVAGDFLKVYTTHNDWNCVATCFFIDCAPNVIDFVETIYNILKPGGIWINLGPLLYHYSDIANESSIEPPFDILCDIITDVGFVMEIVKPSMKTKYSQNPQSMLQYEYDSVFFVCRKPTSSIGSPLRIL